MGNNNVNNIKQDFTAQEYGVSKTNAEVIDEDVKVNQKIYIKPQLIFMAIMGTILIVYLCAVPFMLEGGGNPYGGLIFVIICFVVVAALVLISLFTQIRQNKNEQTEKIKIKLIDNNFIFSKTINILATGWSSNKLYIDSVNKKFIYRNGKAYSKVYRFSDLISYEVYENGKSQVQGRAGSALIGGAFFGLGGLIVGSSMSRKIDEKCNQLKLIIRLNDFNCPQIVITYVDNVDWDKNGWTYRNMKENLQSVCSMLEFMLNEKSLEQSSTAKQEELSAKKANKEQLQELKEMLDDGLITQEDFEQKKKQILGL